MQTVGVSDMRIQTHEGKAVLAIKVDSTVTKLSASFFAHDSVDVAWRGGIPFSPTNDPLIWVAPWNPDAGLPPLLEVGNVTIGSPTLAPLVPGPTRWVFLRSDAGVWISGRQAHAERERREKLRQQHFEGPLVAPQTAQEAPEFYILAIADNLLLTQEQRVPGMSLKPIASVLGDDIRVVLNDLLQRRGFRQGLKPDKWIEKMRQDRPAVVIECRVQAESPDAAKEFSSEAIKRMLDLMTLRRRAAARLIGGVVGHQTDSDHYDVRGIWIEHSGYTGNWMGGIISGEDIHGLQASWSGLQVNPRAQLWASLYADAVRDTRWDYQFFRCFTLLETIAEDVVPSKKTIIDAAGNPRLKSDGKPYSTREARGKVYELLMHMAAKVPTSPASFTCQKPSPTVEAADQLWDELSIWGQVRNDVAHEGAWQPPHPAEKPAHAATRAAIASRGHDGTFEFGSREIVKKIQEAVRTVLFAAIHGTL
jgi:hypothetical protein